MDEKIKKHINKILEKTFKIVQHAYDYNKEGEEQSSRDGIETRLAFPRTRENGLRISEQELRFAFVEAFNQYCNCKENNANLFYAVEVPTKDVYKFSDGKPRTAEGRSAAFDLVIYDEHMKRVCLIEFKAKNANKQSHEKDFCKLENEKEGGECIYFVEILKNYRNGTIKNLSEKYELRENKEKDRINFKFYSLTPASDGKHDITKEITGKE